MPSKGIGKSTENPYMELMQKLLFDEPVKTKNYEKILELLSGICKQIVVYSPVITKKEQSRIISKLEAEPYKTVKTKEFKMLHMVNSANKCVESMKDQETKYRQDKKGNISRKSVKMWIEVALQYESMAENLETWKSMVNIERKMPKKIIVKGLFENINQDILHKIVLKNLTETKEQDRTKKYLLEKLMGEQKSEYEEIFKKFPQDFSKQMKKFGFVNKKYVYIIEDEAKKELALEKKSQNFEEIMYRIVNKHYTKDDLKVIIEFYETDSGKRLKKVEPLIMEEIFTEFQQIGERMGKSIMKKSIARAKREGVRKR